MKKSRFLLAIIVLSFIIFPDMILAEEALKVTFKTNFSQDIDIENMGSILIMMDDAIPKSHDIELTYDNNYKYELTGLINGDIVINNLFVSRDYSGKYDLSSNQRRISNSEIEVTINVKLSTAKEKTTVKVNNAIFADLFGDQYVNQVTQPITSAGKDDGYEEHTATTTKEAGASDETTNSWIENSSRTTTTDSNGNNEEQSKRIEEQRKEQEKKEEQEKRNQIYIIILIVIIIVLLIAIIFVVIKFANANK